MSRFVTPGHVRLPLSGGEWLDVKRELNAGEQRQVFTDLVKSMRAGESPLVDPAQVGITKLVQFIVGWSFVDDQGIAVPFSLGALVGLDIDTFEEIIEVIDAHDEAQEKARDERKKKRIGATASNPTSPSAG